MAVLYRKYRPQTFLEVLNQKAIIQTLKNQVKSGGIAHAYLFTGSRGIGKTSVARILAKAVNCVGKSQQTADSRQLGDACGICEVCKQIEAGNFLDLVEIDAASNTGVDNIRELIEHVKFAPSIGKYKVFIIDEVHMLSKGAFNALLKTLEEPPKHAIFILATTEINKVPATIISRTQRFDFKAYSAEDLMPLLEKISKAEGLEFKKEVLELVAQNAQGSARDALSLLDKIMTLGAEAGLEDIQQLLGITDFGVCVNLLQTIAQGQAAEIPKFYEELSSRGLDYSIFNRDFLEVLRKVLICKITQNKTDFGLAKEHQDQLNFLAEKLSANEIIFTIRLFLKSYKDLASSPEPQIPLLIASLEAALRRQQTADNKKLTAHPKEVKDDQKSGRDYLPNQKEQPPMVESRVVQADAEQVVIIASAQSDQMPQVDLTEVQSFWPKVVEKIKAINGPLASMLRNTELAGVDGGRIVLVVKFLFDKQSLETAKNSALICTTIEQVSGRKMGIAAQVIKQQKATDSTAVEIIGDALKVFGGELIE